MQNVTLIIFGYLLCVFSIGLILAVSFSYDKYEQRKRLKKSRGKWITKAPYHNNNITDINARK